jgi:hypothetical protein
MGSVKKIEKTDLQTFCDDVYTELAGMRMKLIAVTDELSLNYGDDTVPFTTFKRHLIELAEQIEWKLQILSHACPFDWKGSKETVESVVSVRQTDPASGPDFSGGYLGG